MRAEKPNQYIHCSETKPKTIKAMKREALKKQTMSLDMEKMAVELAQKYQDAMVQKHIRRSYTKKDLAQEIIEVSDHVSECYPSLTPKFFGFTFAFEEDNVYLEFLLDEDVPDGSEKRYVLFSIEELRKVAKLNTDYVAAKIINKVKEVTKHDTLLKCGYIPVFLFFVGVVVDEDYDVVDEEYFVDDEEYYVGDKEHYDLFRDIYNCLYLFMGELESNEIHYYAGYMYCLVVLNQPVIASRITVPYEQKPLSGEVDNYSIIKAAIHDKEGSLVFWCDYDFGYGYYKEYLGKVKDMSLHMFLDCIEEAVLRVKEIYKALNGTFDAVYMEVCLTEDCLQSIQDLKWFLERTPYIRSVPPIIFSLKR